MNPVSDPLLYQAQITAAFVQENLPGLNAHQAPTTVLDVGCGEGQIAALLQAQGMKVLAIDLDEDALTKARNRGIDGRRLDFVSEHRRLPQNHFDAILFSRSLHHIMPLEQALMQTQDLLKSGGKVLIEDFGWELADQATALWLFALADLLRSSLPAESKQIQRHRWLTLRDDAQPDRTACGAQESWRHHHQVKHQVSSFAEMQAAISKHLQVLSCTAQPFLFRYLCDLLPAAPETQTQTQTQTIAQALEEFERGLSGCGAIALCGRRIVATIK